MVPWRDAMERALYGPSGFYRRGQLPGDHFRTSVLATPLFAAAIARLVLEVDEMLGHPDRFDLVDLGSGRAELLALLQEMLPESLRERVNLIAVEVVERPDEIHPSITWTRHPPSHIQGLMIANEWLDNIPLSVVQKRGPSLSSVLVDESGTEMLGDAPSDEEQKWLERWWPISAGQDGDRAEVGLTRDQAWKQAVSCLDRGVAVAIDYHHGLEARQRGDYASGTLAGFRSGRWVEPVPDGTCDITAHVALDACAAAGEETTVTCTVITSQRQALFGLGLSGSRPAIERATSNPTKYVNELSEASQAAELLDPAGLGSFGWLVQTRGIELPSSLR